MTNKQKLAQALKLKKFGNKKNDALIKKFKVKISNIRVEGDYDGYYYFDWEVTMDGKTKKGKYDADWSSQSNTSMRNTLKRGYAVELAICAFFGF